VKTHILQLEQYDDIISARDKMGWAKTGRILVVWPERGRMLHRPLDLVLLQRHSESLGAQLALVTRDPDVRHHAPRLGIPVFKDLRKAQSAPWRVPRRFRKALGEYPRSLLDESKLQAEPEVAVERTLPQRPQIAGLGLNPLARLAFFALGVLALLAIAATLLPSAQVALAPVRRTQEITIGVQAHAGDTEVNLSGEVPARQVSVVVEGRDRLPVSGSIQLPDRPAIGYILFTNLGDGPVSVPEGTVVRGLGLDAVRFAVTQTGSLPPGLGESLSLPVRCLTPGTEGNLPTGSLVAIEGPLGTGLSVTNPQPTRHGADRQEPTPTESDRRQLSTRLRGSLETTALEELGESLQDGDLLVPASLSLVKILEENYQPAQKQPADHLQLSLRLEYQALVISGEDLRALTLAVLNANLPKGFDPLDGSLEIEHLGAPVLGSDSVARWKMGARRQLQARVSEPQIVRMALGLDPQQASQRLEATLPLETSPEIELVPSWWPRLPILPFRIVVLEQEAGK
jgi:hypothetical protein